MFDRKVVRRRRAVLAVFVALSIALLTAYFGEAAGGPLHALQRGAGEALAPIESGASRALKPARDLIGWFGDALDAKDENAELRQEVEDLRGRLAEAQTASRDAQQLRGLVGLTRSAGFPGGVEPITSRVIARSPTVWYSTVQIDKGRDDGVEVDQPVIAAGGLVGKVASVSGGNARVTLITDASSAVSAQIVPGGANGIVKPEVGNPDDLLLDFVQKGRKLEEGATVVTSGIASSEFESLFPRGIPIGRVKRADADEVELYQRVHIDPFADVRRMDYVQVLTGSGAGAPARADSASQRAEASSP